MKMIIERKMSDKNPIIESFELSKDYYYFIKDTFNDYTKYLKQYKIIGSSFVKKLIQFQEKFGQPLLDLDKLKNKYKIFKISEIYEITSIVPNIIQQVIKNFNESLVELNSIIENMDKIWGEKVNIEKKEEDDADFDISKNDLIKSYKNIDKNKNAYLNKMNNVEDNILKYFSNLYKDHEIISEDNPNKKDKDKSDNIISKDQLNILIQDAKKSESQYISSFDSKEELENSYNITSQIYKLEFSNYSLDLTNKLKKIIFDTTIALKNNFSEPLNEVAMILEKLNDLEKNNNFEKIINESFNLNKNKQKQKLTKYKIKILNEPKIINKQKNPKNHLIFLEDGLGEMAYLNNYSSVYTINKLYESFELIEKDYKFDLKSDLDKIKTKEISKKLLSYLDKYKTEKKDTDNILISEDEIKILKELLNEHSNRVIFLQDLNTFRSKGLYGIPKDIFDLWNELFLIMADTISKDKDFHTGKNLIILSQTYYYLTNEGHKHYMLEEIKKNPIFTNFNFWEGYIELSIEKEIIKVIQNDQKNGTLIKKTQKESDDMYGSVVFAQLVSISDNMINFNFDMKKIKEIIKPIIKHYNLNEDSINIIDDIIHKNSLRKSILLNDEIKQFDGNQIHKKFDVFGSINLNTINEQPEVENNNEEKLEDIFNNPKSDEEKNE